MGYDAYKALGVALTLSFITMYFVTYLNLASASHFAFSLTRVYSALLMVSVMAVIMVMVMRSMYEDPRANRAIIIGSVLFFALVLSLLRTQTFVGDDAYMRAMIPHHSSAILKSEQANIEDPRVRELADEIIEAQREEIALMRELLSARANASAD